jgi:hypothetical protein
MVKFTHFKLFQRRMSEAIRVPPADDAGHIVRARFEEFIKNFTVVSVNDELSQQRY